MAKKKEKPSSGYAHEALHTVDIIQNMIEDYLLSNPVVCSNATIRSEIAIASRVLGNAYQNLGQEMDKLQIVENNEQ